MVRSTWGYQVADIVSALQVYCERTARDPKTTYVWICFACINQHQVKEQHNVSPEAFQEEFDSRIEGTGHVLSLLAPWSDPANLKRVWVSLLFVVCYPIPWGCQSRRLSHRFEFSLCCAVPL